MARRRARTAQSRLQRRGRRRRCARAVLLTRVGGSGRCMPLLREQRKVATTCAYVHDLARLLPAAAAPEAAANGVWEPGCAALDH